jgi:hypothetical protein
MGIEERVRRNKEEAQGANARANPFPIPFRRALSVGDASNSAPNGANVGPRARVSGSIPGAVPSVNRRVPAARYFLGPDALASNPKIQAAIGEFASGKLPVNKFALLVAAEADAIYKAKRVDRKEDEIRNAVKALVDYAVANGVKQPPDALEAKILGGFGFFNRR